MLAKVKTIKGPNIIIEVYKKSFSKRLIKKINKIIKKYNVETYVIDPKYDEYKNRINAKVLNGSIIMKYMVVNILDFVCKKEGDLLSLINVSALVNNDFYKDILIDIARNVKCLNIVTTDIRKLRRLNSKLEKMPEINFSISNNKNKALKSAKYVINFDFTEDMFNDFYKNDILFFINTKDQFKKVYNFKVINKIQIDYKLENFIELYNIFDNSMLYESLIYNFNYREARKKINQDLVNIIDLL